MPNNIISQCLNLSNVKVVSCLVQNKEAHFILARDLSKGLCCSHCRKLVSRASLYRKIKLRDLPVFNHKSWLVLNKYRVHCITCGFKSEALDFALPFSRCTIRFEELAAMMCRITSVKQTAEFLNLDWKTVKGIDKRYLQKQFALPDYSSLTQIAIDEISSRKGHNYFTIVLDLNRTRVVWVGKGRKQETLDRFFKELGPLKAKELRATAIDMWDPYIASLRKHSPHARIVFDKFHVLKMFSSVIDRVRNNEYRKASKKDKEVIKDSKYLLLKNRQNLTKNQKRNEKKDLRRLLKLNKNINLVYILKADLKRLWNYRYPACAQKFLDSWIQIARAANIRSLTAFTKTLKRYSYGLINHCYYPIDTAKLEGMNNKIKVVKRIAYGFHDDEYFILKIKQACCGYENTT